MRRSEITCILCKAALSSSPHAPLERAYIKTSDLLPQDTEGLLLCALKQIESEFTWSTSSAQNKVMTACHFYFKLKLLSSEFLLLDAPIVLFL